MYMMATKALHQIGDVSSDEPDICRLYDEQPEGVDYYLGEWVTGLGLINVKFPKKTTRPLTEEEKEYYRKQSYGMYGMFSGDFSYSLPKLDIK